MKKFLMLTAITMIASCCTVIAQQEPTLKPSVSAKSLAPVIDQRPSPPLNFKAWLEDRRTYYKAWPARL